MIEVQITDDNDIQNILRLQQGGRWDTDARSLRCPEHSRGVGLTINGVALDMNPGGQQMQISVVMNGCCEIFVGEVLESARSIWDFKVESLMADQGSISMISRYLKGPGRDPVSRLACSIHGKAVEVRLREDAIRLRACCEQALVKKAEQIGLTMRKLDGLDKRQNYKNN